VIVAMSTGDTILAWIGLVVLLVVAVLVWNMLQAILRPLQEIDRYSKDILDGGIGIAKNLDGADQLVRTRELGGAVPGLAVAYLKKAGLLR
jgi:hypothetical protein